MDPDFNGKYELRDVFYILRALARKYRFLVKPPAVYLSDCGITVSTSVVSPERTKVLLRITRDGNEQWIQMSGPQNGEFNASEKVENGQNVQVFVLVETSGQDGYVGTNRYCPWYGGIIGVEQRSNITFEPIYSETIDETVCPLVIPANARVVKAAASTETVAALAAIMAFFILILILVLVLVICWCCGCCCFLKKYEIFIIVPRGSSVRKGYQVNKKGHLRLMMASNATIQHVADAIVEALIDLPFILKGKNQRQYPFLLRRVMFTSKGTMSVVPVDFDGARAALPFDETLHRLNIPHHATLELKGYTYVLFYVPEYLDKKDHKSLDDHNRIPIVTMASMNIPSLKTQIGKAVDGLPDKFNLGIWESDDTAAWDVDKLPEKEDVTLRELYIGNGATVMLCTEMVEILVVPPEGSSVVGGEIDEDNQVLIRVAANSTLKQVREQIRACIHGVNERSIEQLAMACGGRNVKSRDGEYFEDSVTLEDLNVTGQALITLPEPNTKMNIFFILPPGLFARQITQQQIISLVCQNMTI